MTTLRAILRTCVAVVGAWLVLGLQPAVAQQPACTQPPPVCDARGFVFAISGFDPVASAVRIDDETLITVRHSVADETEVMVLLEDGSRRSAEVIPTAFVGDLILLRAADLPDGPVAEIDTAEPDEAVFTVGADVRQRTIVAYDPGTVGHLPAEGFARARLHHSAFSQPGNSGGALVDGEGRLVGIVASGGEGRFEAVPASAVAEIRALSGPEHAATSAEVGAANRICVLKLDEARVNLRGLEDADAMAIATACRRSNNRQNLDLAAQALGISGRTATAVALYEEALAIDPNATNTRLGLAIALHIAARYEDALPHLRALMGEIGEDPQVLRLAIQSGIWGGDPELSERAFETLQRINPQMAPAARRFLDNPPPRPPRRDR